MTAFARKVGVPGEVGGVARPCRGYWWRESATHGSVRAPKKFHQKSGEVMMHLRLPMICGECGKRKVLVRPKGGRVRSLPAKMHHDVCRQCWFRFVS